MSKKNKYRDKTFIKIKHLYNQTNSINLIKQQLKIHIRKCYF